IAIITLPGIRGLIGPPALAPLLIALLLLTPAAVALKTALAGLAPVTRALAGMGHEPEQAVLRIVVAALVFGYAAVAALAMGAPPAASLAVTVAASGILAGWGVLLHLVLRPAVSRLRRGGAMILDS